MSFLNKDTTYYFVYVLDDTGESNLFQLETQKEVKAFTKMYKAKGKYFKIIKGVELNNKLQKGAK